MCEVAVKKSQDASDASYGAVFVGLYWRCGEAKTLHLRNALLLRTCRHLDRLTNPKQSINLSKCAWGDVWKAHSRYLKLNLDAKLDEFKMDCPPPSLCLFYSYIKWKLPCIFGKKIYCLTGPPPERFPKLRPCKGTWPFFTYLHGNVYLVFLTDIWLDWIHFNI